VTRAEFIGKEDTTDGREFSDRDIELLKTAWWENGEGTKVAAVA
jgi:hypothetical protein